MNTNIYCPDKTKSNLEVLKTDKRINVNHNKNYYFRLSVFNMIYYNGMNSTKKKIFRNFIPSGTFRRFDCLPTFLRIVVPSCSALQKSHGIPDPEDEDNTLYRKVSNCLPF